MQQLAGQLLNAAYGGRAADVKACLAAGVHPGVTDSNGWTPMHAAAYGGHAECLAALIAGNAEANCFTKSGRSPLHFAASQNHEDCVQLLLAAGADPLAVLLQAGPAAASATSARVLHDTPLTLAIRNASDAAARCLLEHGPLPQTGEVLAALASAGAWAQPLYTLLVSRQPLTAEEWGMVPNPCTGLGTVLPAVLGRSADEAALLVRHLPAADRERLRTAALCLARAQQRASAFLPAPITWRILAQFLSI